MSEEILLEIKKLKKTFRLGFFMKKIEAVKDVSIEVRKGEIFGLLGPNGAGKTTTLKAIMGLIKPTSGQIKIFGKNSDDVSLRKKIGFLPENPYFYDYLKPVEFLCYIGALYGLSFKERKQKAKILLKKVGLKGNEKMPLRKFSKGMLQRIGIAQTLIGDPELFILDEPMSGLDPIGRKEIRDLLLSLKSEGKTIIFSSHILSDVETICDRVAIINKGVVRLTGTLDQLLKAEARRTTFEIENINQSLVEKIKSLCFGYKKVGNSHVFEVEGEEQKKRIIKLVIESGGEINSIIPHRETLENIFIRDGISIQ